MATSDVSHPLWAAAATAARRPLTDHTSADVCVVGAGIAGLTTAYLLRKSGREVVVLDDGPIGGGQTVRTTAHLSNAIDDRYVELERLHGADGSRLAAESHGAAIEAIERIVAEESIACDFARVDGFLFDPEPNANGGSRMLLDELAAAHRAGLADVEMVPRAPLEGFDTGPCLRFPRQGRCEPMRYLEGLAHAFERAGGRIFVGSHADEIAGGRPARVVTSGGQIVSCSAVVVATNSPVNDRYAIHTKQAPYLTYAIAALVPAGSVPDVLLWDTLDAYHYVRLQPGRGEGGDPALDYLIVGGEDHKTGQARDGAERFARLEQWTRRRFPSVRSVAHRWAGQVMETSDGLAFLGRNPGDEDNVFIATGDSGHGMTHGTIAGLLLTDLIAGRPNPWEKLYDPSRVRLAAARDLLSENLNVAAQYVSWVSGGDVSGEDEIAPGSGAVVRSGLEKLAVYRDEAGTFHRRSAVCPHLGCIVAWNPVDRSWDCPCHGSRFACTGRVINGPANSDLAATGDAGDEEKSGELHAE